MMYRDRVAIVGMGGMFPGAADLAEFWRIIAEARSVACEPPAGRWALPVDEVYAAKIAADKVLSRRACFVTDEPYEPTGLAIDPALLARLDPVFHVLLRAGRAAWNDAATKQADRSRVGVIVGNIVLPTDSAGAMADELFGPEFERQIFGITAGINPRPHLRAAGFTPTVCATEPLNKFASGLPAGILAQALGFGGGTYALDAACASSLYAIKLAVDELLAGRADAMLAGGVSRPDSLYTQMGFSQLGALSPSGRCAPFDAAADGLVVGEGAGVVVLKRLADAIRDGDRIYATIAGIGLTNDIGGNLMLPDSEGQVRAMRAAYRQAGWSPRDIDLVECHGTGTPVGDAIEFASLSQLWADAEGPPHSSREKCVLGSVKSNVGHLLTAAGAAGLVKVLLAMREGVLAPTAHFSKAAKKIELDSSPFCVLSRAAEWQRRGEDVPRRAAVSAFGFGGINAHLLVEEWTAEPRRATVVSSPGQLAAEKHDESVIAIVGLDAACGPWTSTAALHEQIFSSGDHQVASANETTFGLALPTGVQALPIPRIDISVGRFRIPPHELAEMLPQQLLMLHVAANAWEDFDPGAPRSSDEPRIRTGVFVGIGLDFNTANFHFRWTIARRARTWADALGLDLDDAAIERWNAALRDAASPPLSANRTMGALGGIVASRIARAFRVGGPSFTVSSEETSGISALKVAVEALRRGDLDTAIVGAVDFATDPRSIAAERSSAKGFASHNRFADGAVAFILKRHDDAVRDGNHVYAVIRDVEIAGAVAHDDAAAASADDDNIVHTGAASGLFSVLRAVLAIGHDTLPSARTDKANSASYWLHNRADGPRRALVTARSTNGNRARVVLQESVAGKKPDVRSMARQTLIAVTGETPDELVGRLRDSRASIERAGTVDDRALAASVSREFPPHADHPLAASIVVDGGTPLFRILREAESHVLRSERVRGPNVFYEPRPVCSAGRASDALALVFPGAGNQYLQMGRDLARAFPDVLRRLDAENERLADQFASGRFWTADTLDEISHQNVAFGQVWLGSLVADVLATFGVRPNAVVGYSLGESAGLFALRAWRDRDEMLRRMDASTLFTHDLAGECRAARATWRLGEGEPLEWSIGVVNRPASAVRQALVGRTRVYLLIVNTPAQCVIGGQRQSVDELVVALGCGFHPLHGVTTVHCEVARPVADAYRQLHLLPTYPPQPVRFYSGVWGRAYELTSESAADSIVAQAVGPFDFPRVVEQAYADGVRIFVEAGPGNSCTRMIGQILRDRPHVAVAACTPGENEHVQVLRVLAELIAHRTHVDLSRLFPDDNDRSAAAPPGRPVVSIPCIHKPFDVPKPPPGKKRHVVRVAAPSNPWLTRPSHALAQIAATESAKIGAESAFLALSRETIGATQRLLSRSSDLRARERAAGFTPAVHSRSRTPVLDRAACHQFATGSIARVLGHDFAEIDRLPTRVRLPDEPLMLVDRIVSIEGEPRSLSSGRVITEHDILPDAWYLDGGRIPTCIAVEAGQADLFLSAYLGVDFATRGRAVYRLLDAAVTFHRSLPGPGETIRYDIRIDRFFRQGQMHLFRFRFEATVDGRPLISMRDGCAGFFTPEELTAGQGIVQTAIDRRELDGIQPSDWRELAPPAGVESYDDHQIDALRRGDLARCFGATFANLPIERPAGLPGGRMTLVHRVLRLDPHGGRFKLGQILGEADIRPDHWYLTCHFVDDRVMPGTLMYECCLHTLRIFLLRLGWVGEADEIVYEPIPGVASQLKCRGQVTETTRKVQYELSIKELGYQAPDGTPYVKADALMYADGRAIVQMNNMSLRLSGLTRAKVETLWPVGGVPVRWDRRPAIFDRDRILAFAIGKPSDAFGAQYHPFDSQRVIARLPGPPYQFLDRIVAIGGCRQWELAAGGVIEAQYDVPPDAWYFAANRQPVMPFAVLLEVALQPCGWLAAYLGSALASDVDLSFRNLGGRGIQLRRVTPDSGTLMTTVKITKVAKSGGMIIENFEFVVRDGAGEVYRGDTYFGFFSKQSLTNQVGIREAAAYEPNQSETLRARRLAYPTSEPYPDNRLRMVDRIVRFDPQGGPKELGFIRGVADVKPDAWFFKAHFHQDPVWPGSLGLESFLQLLKFAAFERWGTSRAIVDAVALGGEHRWTYRGQILPTDRQVTVQASIHRIDDANPTLWAAGHLSVDGRLIYQMDDFSVRIEPK